MVRRNHEQVGGRLRIQILEGHHAVGPLDDGRRDLARRDLAENATGHHPPIGFPGLTRGARAHVPPGFTPGAMAIARTPAAAAPRASGPPGLPPVVRSRPSPAARAPPAAPA